MKRIVKGNEPNTFIAWKNMANDSWQPSWTSLQNPEKSAVKNSLIQEQGKICCYCEQKITENNSHIEHIRPRSICSEAEKLDCQNLLASCGPAKKKGEPSHCGGEKGEWYDEDTFISPLGDNCETRFIYLGNGSVKPAVANDRSAQITIEKLALNIPKLISLRNALIDVIISLEFNESELQVFLNNYIICNEDGSYNEFWSTAKSLFD